MKLSSRYLVIFLLATAVLFVARDFPATSVLAQPSIPTPVACDKSVVVSGSSATTAELVALVTGQRVYVCGVVFSGGGTTTAKLVSGTGSACATGQANVTGAIELADNTTATLGYGYGSMARTTGGQAVCWTNTVGVQVSGILSYAQF